MRVTVTVSVPVSVGTPIMKYNSEDFLRVLGNGSSRGSRSASKGAVSFV